MTHGEVMKLTIEIRRRWPHGDMPSDDQYHHHLKDLHAHQVMAVVEVLEREGEKFAPTGARIRKRLGELAVNAPEWYAVMIELRERQVSEARRGRRAHAIESGRTCPVGECDGGGITELDDQERVILSGAVGVRPASTRRCRCHDALLMESTGREPAHWLVETFITKVLDQRVIYEILNGDTTAEAQSRTKYQAYCAQVQRAFDFVGIADEGLPGIAGPQQEAERIGLRKIQTLGSGDVAA